MKPRALLACLACSLLADAAVAAEPAPPSPPPPLVEQARALVKTHVVQAIEQRDRKRSAFSRAPAAPTARRVRVLDATPQRDAHGHGYVRFAIDSRWDGEEDWSKDDIAGCVYVDTGVVFVDVGDAFRGAADVFAGRHGDDVPVVCRPAAASTTNG